MSNYAMSPPQQQAPRPYSPQTFQAATSPTNPSPYGPPPAKRPRLSPEDRSPMVSGPTTATIPYATPPYGVYGNPFAQKGQSAAPSPYPSPSAYASPTQNPFNAPQYHPQWRSQTATPNAAASGPPTRQMSPAQSSQMMPPPPRPNREDREERANIEDIGDSLHQSGINIRDEENYMHTDFDRRYGGNGSFGSTTQGTSFGSTTFSGSGVNGTDSFHQLTQLSSFTQGQDGQNGAFAGTFGATQTEEDIEAEIKRKRAEAARARNERREHHMNNQFLLTNCVRKRLIDRANEQGVAVNLQGLYQRTDAYKTEVMVNGAATPDGIVAASVDTRPEFTATKGEPFEQLMCLISLAGGECLRGLLDETYALARARRYGDHGRVPPEFAENAVGEGEATRDSVVPEHITGSQWDAVPSDDQDQKEGKDDEPARSATPQPQSTVSYSSAVAAKLRQVADRDRLAEEARLAKREARRKAAVAASTNAEGADAIMTDAPAIAAASEAVSASEPARITKKEQARREKEAKNQLEAQSHALSNQTAAQFSMPSSKLKKYSWMNAGKPSLENRYKASTPTSGTSTPGGVVARGKPATTDAASPNAGPATAVDPEAKKAVEWGDWKEDGGIQARDWVLVLERDGRHKKTLQRVLNKLS